MSVYFRNTHTRGRESQVGAALRLLQAPAGCQGIWQDLGCPGALPAKGRLSIAWLPRLASALRGTGNVRV